MSEKLVKTVMEKEVLNLQLGDPKSLFINPSDAKHIPLLFIFEDGCEFEMHGKDYKPGWFLGLEFIGKIKIICPHGYEAFIETKIKEDKWP